MSLIEGRNILISVETVHDVIGSSWNICSAVHEYGGAPCIINDGVVFFSNLADGKIYKTRESEAPIPVTPGALSSSRFELEY